MHVKNGLSGDCVVVVCVLQSEQAYEVFDNLHTYYFISAISG